MATERQQRGKVMKARIVSVAGSWPIALIADAFLCLDARSIKTPEKSK